MPGEDGRRAERYGSREGSGESGIKRLCGSKHNAIAGVQARMHSFSLKSSVTLEPRSSGVQSANPWKEEASTMKGSGISFHGDVRKLNSIWFLHQFEEVANLAHQSDVQKHALLKGFMRGPASQWIRLLDVPTYTSPGKFKDE